MCRCFFETQVLKPTLLTVGPTATLHFSTVFRVPGNLKPQVSTFRDFECSKKKGQNPHCESLIFEALTLFAGQLNFAFLLVFVRLYERAVC